MRKKKQKTKKKQPTLGLTQQLLLGYLLVMFGVFPVFCTDGFFNIRHDRYYFFLAISGLLLTSLGLAWLFDLPEHRSESLALRTAKAKTAGPWYRRLTSTDWGMLGFLVCCIGSTALSPYRMDALLGTAGRNNGLLLMAVYVGVYFAVSRFRKDSPVIWVVFGAVSSFVSLVAVLNFFHLDPLNMLAPLMEQDKLRFISTIGNRNFLSAYLCLTVPLLAVLSVEAKLPVLRYLSLAAAGLGFAAMMAADSDSGFLGLGVFVALYLIRYAREPEQLKRFFLALTMMLLCGKLLALVPGEHKNMGSLQQFFVYSPGSLCLLVFLAAETGLMWWLHKKNPQGKFPLSMQLIPAAVLALATLALLGLFVYLNFVDPSAALESQWDLLHISDTWGTNRGFIWKKTLDIFLNFSPKEMLLGLGPDTFYYAFEPHFEALSQLGDSSTNAAHNEYLNHLITLGVAGLTTWLWVLGTAVLRGVRRLKADPMVAAVLASVICSAVQATVNIAQPITTPLFIILLALCAGCREPVEIFETPAKSKKKTK